MSRKGQEPEQKKQRCKDCGRRVGVQADGKPVQHKCEPVRKEGKKQGCAPAG